MALNLESSTASSMFCTVGERSFAVTIAKSLNESARTPVAATARMVRALNEACMLCRAKSVKRLVEFGSRVR